MTRSVNTQSCSSCLLSVILGLLKRSLTCNRLVQSSRPVVDAKKPIFISARYLLEISTVFIRHSSPAIFIFVLHISFFSLLITLRRLLISAIFCDVVHRAFGITTPSTSSIPHPKHLPHLPIWVSPPKESNPRSISYYNIDLPHRAAPEMHHRGAYPGLSVAYPRKPCASTLA